MNDFGDIVMMTAQIEGLRTLLAEADEQRDRLKESIAITDRNMRSMQEELNKLRAFAIEAEDRGVDLRDDRAAPPCQHVWRTEGGRFRCAECGQWEHETPAENSGSLGATLSRYERYLSREMNYDQVHDTAETPAPTDLWKCSMCGRCTVGEAQDKAEINCLRAQLAAANERITFLEFSVTDRRRQKDEEIAAHAATKAQLARVMAILPDALLWVEAESINLSDAMPYEACIDEIKAILADADSKDAGDARRGGGRVCSTCNDTHLMSLGDDEVMCTRCPRPCQKCRIGGNGAYCSTTPCACDCHGGDS